MVETGIKQACSKGSVVAGMQSVVWRTVGRSSLLKNPAGMGETGMNLAYCGVWHAELLWKATIQVTQHEDH